MAVTKRPRAIGKEEQRQVEEVINQGSPPPPKAAKKSSSKEVGKDVQFVMSIPPDLADIIDKVRGTTKTSRRSWFLMAAIEKLKKDGDLI